MTQWIRSLISAAGLTLSTLALAQTPNCNFVAKSAPTGKAQALAQEAEKTNPCTTVPGLTAKTLRSVWGSLMASSTSGGKRFDTLPPAGTPTGKVMATAKGIAFNLQAVSNEGVLGLQVTSDGVPVYSIANTVQALVWVPAERLKPGSNYDWSLITRKANYRASFEVVGADEVAALQLRLDALERASLSPEMRLLYTAALYDDAELYNARDQLLAQLRAQLSP